MSDITLAALETAGAAEAFALGRSEPLGYRNPRLAVTEASEAAASWRTAQSDHAETSYFGAARIRCARAYWLGKLRSARLAAQAEGLRPGGGVYR